MCVTHANVEQGTDREQDESLKQVLLRTAAYIRFVSR
jgi:hypothetical protein